MFSTALYKRAPLIVQEGLISLRAWSRARIREGSQFDRALHQIRAMQHLSRDELLRYQEVKLSELIEHAVTQVPFYRDLRLPSIVKSLTPHEALKAFPIIDKQVVRTNSTRFIADNAKRPLFKGSTSGTTGTPLTILQDFTAISREHAFTRLRLEWAGYRVGDRQAWLRGDLIVPVDSRSPPFWRMNWTENMLMLSSYHLSDSTADSYITALEVHDPVVIQAYPSSIAFLAKWLESRNRSYKGRALSGIVTSSETLNREDCSVIERCFGCRVFDWYGQFERVAVIGTCEYGSHHILDSYSHVELAPEDGGLHEIIGTGFNNLAMPLIRYRTNDRVKVAAHHSTCSCGRAFPLVEEIMGRQDDILILPDGRRMGRLDHLFKGLDTLLEAQIVQNRRDEILIRVVPAVSFDAEMEQAILRKAREYLGSELHIRVEATNRIERTRNGKLQFVKCNVTPNIS